MSGNDGGGEASIPFGFTFIGHEDQGQDDTHPPSGPPLLDNNETGLLRDFFNNPNNIDPGFLALAQSRQQEQDLYASPQQQWFLSQDQSHPNATSSHQAPSTQQFGQRQDPNEEVYAAARLLHQHQGPYTNGAISSPSYPSASHAPSGHLYSYPQSPPAGFTSHSLGEEQAGYTDPGMHQEGFSHGRSMSSHRPAPLNFGSDREFHGSKYAATQKAPDHDLMNILSSLSHDTSQSPAQSRYRMLPEGSAPATTSRRKRRRSSFAEEESEESEEELPSKSRKMRAGSEDTDDGDSPSTNRSRKRASAKSRGRASPRHKRKSSPAGKKAARENLTEEQKRSNHIQSEQKRRNLIKVGFDDTNRMVPELRTGGFSKSNMLQEAAKFMRELKDGNNRLAALLGMIDKG